MESWVRWLRHDGSSRGWHGGACGVAPSEGLPLDALPLLLHTPNARAGHVIQCNTLDLDPMQAQHFPSGSSSAVTSVAAEDSYMAPRPC